MTKTPGHKSGRCAVRNIMNNVCDSAMYIEPILLPNYDRKKVVAHMFLREPSVSFCKLASCSMGNIYIINR